MYSYVTLVFLREHIGMWSIGQRIAQYFWDKIRTLVGLIVCGTPFVQKLSTEKSSHVFANNLKV